jgi:heme A synthase
MRVLRRLALTALILAYLQIVFGAIVRITGSGLGCGDHWPDCYGSFTPANRGFGLLIEISHRYGAAILSIAVVALALAAFLARDEQGVGGSGGVLRSSVGAATVKLALNPVVIVTHLAIAMSLLAVLSVTVLRTGAFGAQSDLTGASGRTWRAARMAVVLSALTLVLGALTANVPDAATSCGGFPWCRVVNAGGTPLVLQITHRVVAFLLFGHLWGIAAAVPRRNEPRALVRSARIAFGLAVLQVLIAAAMVEMHLPMVLRSLHQATGTLLWLSVCVLAGLSRIASPAESKREISLTPEPA